MTQPTPTAEPSFTTLIDVTTLAGLLRSPALRLFDCRCSLLEPTAGARQYAQGHIPGAQFVDLNSDLSDPVVPGQTGRHPLPAKTAFVARLQRWGISNNSLVVAYDADSSPYAARLWWMLRWAGHKNVAVLDGGYKAWQAAHQASTQTVPTFATSRFIPGPALTREVSAADLQPAPGLLLDARDLARFEGLVEPIDAVAGHIPGAVCAPFTANLEATSCFKPAAELRARFAALGADETTPASCYCGSGVTAAQNLLAMVHAGLPEPALYAGSWSEWITDPQRPVAKLLPTP